MDHSITEAQLKRFATGAASRSERAAVVAHLLHGCAACAARLRELALPEATKKGAYDEVFARLEGFLPDDADPEEPLGSSFSPGFVAGPPPCEGGGRGAPARRP